MLLDTLGAILLGNLLIGKSPLFSASKNKNGKGILRAGSGRQLNF